MIGRFLKLSSEALMTPAEILQILQSEAPDVNWLVDGDGYKYQVEAVADVFDALTSKRCYKDAWETDKAIDYITELSGKQFDPAVVKAFHSSLPKILEAKQTYEDV